MNSTKPIVAPGQDIQKLQRAIEQAESYINQDYMARLTDNESEACKPISGKMGYTGLRLLKIDKIVFNREEDINLRLMNIYHTIHDLVDTFFLLIRGSSDGTGFYIGIRNEDNSPATALYTLKQAIIGNFPGVEFNELRRKEIEEILKGIEESSLHKTVNSVAGLTIVPSERTEETSGLYVQGLEKFIDAMQGLEYTAIILARPLPVYEIQLRRRALEDLSTALSYLESYSVQLGKNDSRSTSNSVADTITNAINSGINLGYGYNTTTATGTQTGNSGNVGIPFQSINLGLGMQTGQFSSVANGQTQSYGYAKSSTQQSGRTTQQGTSETEGTSYSTTFTQKNYSINGLIRQIEKQIQRTELSASYGLWECGSYFVSPAKDVTVFAVNAFRALVSGKDSNLERSYMNIWDSNKNAETVKNILSNLRYALIPQFSVKVNSSPMMCTLGTLVNGFEMPLIMAWPRRSADGISVMKKAAFGRQVYLLNSVKHNDDYTRRKIKIGNVYHMGRPENSLVSLNVNDLSGHCFITGAVGTGKTNATIGIIESLIEQEIPVLIIEPVKGEYRKRFGHVQNTSIFTTTPFVGRMLRLNPFRFNEKTAVLEHIDRLIEVFRMCWPLYAAQPALLRECIETAYLRCGWDLTNSIWLGNGNLRYPTFEDVLNVIPEVIEESRFVGESKGTYEGAILTRIRMLTRGMYGQVFGSSFDLIDQELFQSNVIIDLSNVGSPETVSLIMGMLVVRLREYLAAYCVADNGPLRHVTILEEAHNVFKRASSMGASEEGVSVESKSVELLARCIAEVRGYGEGVFIIDQSPGSVDIASIKNTATKIVFRLPEQSDRLTIGSSLNASEEQIGELAQLPTGVAAIYQNNWAEAVLVQIKKSEEPEATISNDCIAYNDIKRARGVLAKKLLIQLHNGTYEPERLSKLLKDLFPLSKGKQEEYESMFYAYNKGFEMIHGGKELTRIYASLLMELIECRDMFRVLPYPPKPLGANQLTTNPLFVKNCDDWERQAIHALGYYVEGVEDIDLHEILLLLLVAEGEQDGFWYSVRNALNRGTRKV